jgi:hypothetical protein
MGGIFANIPPSAVAIVIVVFAGMKFYYKVKKTLAEQKKTKQK